MPHETLHITNGDSAANLINASSVAGSVLPWRDPMHHGPFPKTTSLDEASSIRARYLGGDNYAKQTRSELASRDDILKRAADSASVVLWFEHDLLDQLQLLQILDYFNNTTAPIDLDLICINQFNGIETFRGLGQLTPEQLALLFPTRTQVTMKQLLLASTIWDAFCDSNPANLLQWITDGDHHSLPFMQRALQRHLEDFPWHSDGLTRTERQCLSLLQNGDFTAGKVFTNNMHLENALYIGDWHTFTVIERLATAKQPLITGASASYQSWTHDNATEFANQPLQLTPLAQQVLNGEVTAHSMINRNYWLGGIDLSRHSWHWHHEQQTLVQKH